MFVSCVFVVCCVGSGMCGKLITRPEESYRFYVCVCVFVSNCMYSINFSNEATLTRVSFVLQKKKSKKTTLTQFAIKSLHISVRLEEANTKFGFYNSTL